ncbi:rCG27115 [Rattus norvegicus]|uniref:RCG27115 n=1 Tax=Rattus norvegicus TaxID=10116 RepID=A6HMT1_RAT|nr:rCG27115 [Rattus norvegicus]
MRTWILRCAASTQSLSRLHGAFLAKQRLGASLKASGKWKPPRAVTQMAQNP